MSNLLEETKIGLRDQVVPKVLEIYIYATM